MDVFSIHILTFFMLFALMLLWKQIAVRQEVDEQALEAGYDYFQALSATKKGRAVSRMGWLVSNPMKVFYVAYGTLEEEGLEPETDWFLCDSAGKCEIYEPTEDDMSAEDWFVVQ